MPTFRMITLDHAIVDFGRICSAMAVVQGGDRLGQHFPDKVFANLILRLSTSSDKLLKIAAVAVLHDDVDFGSLLINYSIVVLDNVRVTKFAKDVYLRNNLLLLLFAHHTVVELFPN